MKMPLCPGALARLGHGDFISYLSGAANAAGKRRIEYHLSRCGPCFESFIDRLNQHLVAGIHPEQATP